MSEIHRDTLGDVDWANATLDELKAILGDDAEVSGVWGQYMEVTGGLAVEIENQGGNPGDYLKYY